MLVKVGDRIKIGSGFKSHQLTELSTQCSPSFNLDNDEVGIIRQAWPGKNATWAIEFDAHQGALLAFSECYLTVIEEAVVVKVKEELLSRPCTCDIVALMRAGCMCGHVKRYVPVNLFGGKTK